MKTPRVVEVYWKDSWSNADGKWTAREMKEEPDFILSSTGYIVHRDKRGINLGSEYREQQQTFRHVQHIPASLILRIKKR